MAGQKQRMQIVINVCLIMFMAWGAWGCSSAGGLVEKPTQPPAVTQAQPTHTLEAPSAPSETALPSVNHTVTPIPPTATVILTSTPTPVVVTEWRVIYHDSEMKNGVATYQAGDIPWIDLLVKLGNLWYGPERQFNDEIEALALPSGYYWKTEGGFACNPDGEAWWTEQFNDGLARLYGPDGQVLLEVPLKVKFEGTDEDDDFDFSFGSGSST
ncbi:MAG: hypothetical protein JXB15_10250 [Anaerolineales bacterium]|nr:hypothetical protein [Anaerolineales bacterium]